MSWETIIAKFEGLVEPYTSSELREEIVEVTHNFEQHSVASLMKLLNNVEINS
jgi:2-methylcitrate dehydratase PrpD